MQHLNPNDLVPQLRSDLSATPPATGTGAEVIRVGPIGAADAIQMHGFEFSIARMLNGKRTVQDVMRNCERLGLPMDLRSLEGFLHQLQAHGLLARESMASQAPPPARMRTSWSPATRELYVEALRHAREGDLAGARRRVADLLGVAPAIDEAQRLAAVLDERPARAPDEFLRLFHEVEERWRNERIDQEPIRAPRSVRPFVVSGLALAAVLGLSMVPLPRLMSASARLTPVSEVPLPAGRDGLIQRVKVREGDRVGVGTELFIWDEDDLKIRLAEARGALEEARQPIRDELGGSKLAQPLMARLRQAEHALARAQSALLSGQKDAAGRAPDDVTQRLEANFAKADARVKELRSQIDSLLTPEMPGARRSQRLAYKVKLLEAQLADPVVRAPVAGVVQDLNLKPGHWVEGEQKVMRIDDLDHLKLTAVVLPSFAKKIRVGEPVTVRVDGVGISSTVESVTDYQVITRFTNPGALKPGPLLVHLEFKPASIWKRLF